jgi:hypothetical protein
MATVIDLLQFKAPLGDVQCLASRVDALDPAR